jgi:hypothetical protein
MKMPTKAELEEYLEQLMRPAVREGLFTAFVGESGRRTWAKTAKYTAERFDECLKRAQAEHETSADGQRRP